MGSMQRSNDRAVQDIVGPRNNQRGPSLLSTSALNQYPNNFSQNNHMHHGEHGLHDSSKLTRKSSQRQIQLQNNQEINQSRSNHESAALTRRGSFHGNSNNFSRGNNHSTPSNGKMLDDEMKLQRKSSFRNHSNHQLPSNQKDSASLSRKSSHHSTINGNNNRSNNGKLKRHMSFRNEHVNYHHNRTTSEVEKEDRRRRRNRESARRARERERSERELMERAYDANEVRIKHLENIVDELSSELRRHNTISTIRSPSQNSQNNSKSSKNFEHSDERPSWFGAAF